MADRMDSVVTWDWWKRRTQVERVVAYTLASVYALYWLILLLEIVSVVATTSPRTGTLAGAGTVVLGGAGTLVLRDSIRLHPDKGPLPWPSLSLLLGLVVVAVSLTVLLPKDPRIGTSLVIVSALSWGAGGLLDTRVRNGILVASAVITGVLGESLALAAFGAAVSAFLIFSVQSSLWLMGVVTSLERARDSEAALAVARERLRFSQDVHDVMGRRLSTIAVQAELAATLAARGEARATDQVLEIRSTAHEALREARELARGYRPLDLPAEVDGAVSLLASAGITTDAHVDDVPPERQESVARVIREAVTNVLRHSRAAQVDLTYARDQLVVSNDGLIPDRPTEGDGSGLDTLADQLAGRGARLSSGIEGDRFVVRVQFAPVVTRTTP
ncbi:MAG TPA: histidine kinase [Nocardioidaceae bacterium]|nr:histidine kinase [Nocardioidaceae bacterium]